MASIKKQTNGRWQARYRDDNGGQHTQRFDRKTDAQAWLDKVTASVVRGDYVDPKTGKAAVAAFAGRWQAVQVSSDGTRRIVDNALRLHLIPALGGRPMTSVRRGDVQGFVKLLEAKGLAPGSVRNIYDVTAQIFAAAVDDRVIPSSPCHKITLPRDETGEVVPPTLEQVTAARAAVPERYRAVVVTLAGSGLRIGELLGLGVPDVDFLRRTIRVERQRMQSGELAPVKSKTSRRTVPVGQVVIDHLAAHLAQYPSGDALFTDELGRPLTYRKWKVLWRDAATTAGVAATSHDLRH